MDTLGRTKVSAKRRATAEKKDSTMVSGRRENKKFVYLKNLF
ncbi:MAG: hypothetical protein R3Y09_09270 [Clostridia bacterium]